MIVDNKLEFSTAATQVNTPFQRPLFFAPIAEWPANHGGSIRTIRMFEEWCSLTQGNGYLVGSNFNYGIQSGQRTINELDAREKPSQSPR